MIFLCTTYSKRLHPLQACSQEGSLGTEEPPSQIKVHNFTTILFKKATNLLTILFEKSPFKRSTILLKRSTILLKRSTILYKRTTQLKFLAMGLRYTPDLLINVF